MRSLEENHRRTSLKKDQLEDRWKFLLNLEVTLDLVRDMITLILSHLRHVKRHEQEIFPDLAHIF